MRGFWPTLLLGIGTYLSRASFIVMLGAREVPPRLERAMRNVGPAVLAALVASLLVGDERWDALTPSPTVLAVVVSVLVAWRTRDMLWALLAGMAAVWIAGPLWP